MSIPEINEYAAHTVGLEYCILCPDQIGKKVTVPYWHPPDFYLEVPCGKCSECRKKKRQGWSFRLIQEILCHQENSFVTLTFENKYLDEFKCDYKKPLKLYIDRLRKYLGFRPRYWFISELGEDNDRFHFHGIFFGTSREKFDYFTQRSKWKYGYVWIGGYCNIKTASYITKYMLKQQKDHKPIIMCSNGIGASWCTDKNKDWLLNGFDLRPFTIFNGLKYAVSPYISRKLLTDDERLCLMLNRFTSKPEERKYYVKGMEFNDYRSYVRHRDIYYKDTLNRGTSLPLKKKSYATICFSESGLAEGWLD